MAEGRRGRDRRVDGVQEGPPGRPDDRHPGRGPVEQLRISGSSSSASVSTIGGATSPASTCRPRSSCSTRGQARPDPRRGASRASRQQRSWPRSEDPAAGTQVRTGDEQAAEDATDTNEFISFLQKFLLAFGGIALFVGAFVIANSLSITIAQRTREFATLRTLGASRRQVLGSVIVEALVIGGARVGRRALPRVGARQGAVRLFDAVGFTLPNSGLVFETRTIVVALLVGILVTLVASLRPALARDAGAADRRGPRGRDAAARRFARFRTLAALLAAAGFAALSRALRSGLGTTRCCSDGLGALLVFFGVALFDRGRRRSPLSPVARWRCRSSPCWSGRCPDAVLAAAVRRMGPGSREAAAFVVGAVLNLLLLVVLAMMARLAVTRGVRNGPPSSRVAPTGDARIGATTRAEPAAHRVDGRGADDRARARDARRDTAAASSNVPTPSTRSSSRDYAITAQNNFSRSRSTPPRRGEARASTSVGRSARARRTSFSTTDLVTAVDPARRRDHLDWVKGSQRRSRQLGHDGAFVDEGYAKTQPGGRLADRRRLRQRDDKRSSASRGSSTRRRADRRSGRDDLHRGVRRVQRGAEEPLHVREHAGRRDRREHRGARRRR